MNQVAKKDKYDRILEFIWFSKGKMLHFNMLIIFSKIISGGQTGVDRAALDVALKLGITCGGWCPNGRKAEDGPIDPRYPLKETLSPNYPHRTEKNVREADGTLVLIKGPLSGGTALTIQLAIEYQKPYLIIDLDNKIDPLFAKEWGEKNHIEILNVAGPSENTVPGIHDQAAQFLKELLERAISDE